MLSHLKCGHSAPMEGEGTVFAFHQGPSPAASLAAVWRGHLGAVPTLPASEWGTQILPALYQFGKATWRGQQARCPEALPPLCASPGEAAQLLPCCVASGRTPSRRAPRWLASVCNVCEVSKSACVHSGAFSVTRTLLETTYSCTSLHTTPCTPLASGKRSEPLASTRSDKNAQVAEPGCS